MWYSTTELIAAKRSPSISGIQDPPDVIRRRCHRCPFDSEGDVFGSTRDVCGDGIRRVEAVSPTIQRLRRHCKRKRARIAPGSSVSMIAEYLRLPCQLPQDVQQNAAVLVVENFLRSIDAHGCGKFLRRTTGGFRRHGQLATIGK